MILLNKCTRKILFYNVRRRSPKSGNWLATLNEGNLYTHWHRRLAFDNVFGVTSRGEISAQRTGSQTRVKWYCCDRPLATRQNNVALNLCLPQTTLPSVVVTVNACLSRRGENIRPQGRGRPIQNRGTAVGGEVPLEYFSNLRIHCDVANSPDSSRCGTRTSHFIQNYSAIYKVVQISRRAENIHSVQSGKKFTFEPIDLISQTIVCYYKYYILVILILLFYIISLYYFN